MLAKTIARLRNGIAISVVSAGRMMARMKPLERTTKPIPRRKGEAQSAHAAPASCAAILSASYATGPPRKSITSFRTMTTRRAFGTRRTYRASKICHSLKTRFEEAIAIPKPVDLDAGRKGRSARRAENDRPYTPSRSSWLARLSWSCLDVGGLGHARRCLLDLSTHRMVEEEKEGKVNHRQLKQAIMLIPRRTE